MVHHHHHHGHGHHDHHHHPGVVQGGEAGRRALRWSLLLNGGFLIIEAVAGLVTGSLALLSDAGHMVGDVSALALAYVVSGLATRPSTPTRTFGLVRAEALGAFVNGLALLVVVAFIVVEAIGRMVEGPPPIAGLPVLVVGGIGLAINLGSAWALWRSASDDLNVRGALAHMLADALGSVGAMASAILILVFGWSWADPAVSLLVAMMVLVGAWRIVAASARVLLDFAPENLDAERVSAALEAVDGVAAVHDVHVWGQSGSRSMVIAHVVPEVGVGLHAVLHAAEATLREGLGIDHTTIQVEPRDGCPQPDCPFAHRAEAPDGDDDDHGDDHEHRHRDHHDHDHH